MESNIDTNINNYNKNELLEIIGLNNNSTELEIEERLNKIIKKYSQENKEEYINFFLNTKKKLLNNQSEENFDYNSSNEDDDDDDNEDDYRDNDRDDEQDDDEEDIDDANKDYDEENNKEENNESDDKNEEQSEYWYRNQYLKQKNKNQNSKITDRTNKIQILDSGSIPIMQREQLGINNTIPLQVAQDSLNPTLIQTTTKIITIDSKYRANILPYSSDPGDITSSTNFSANLSEKLQNVVKLKLNSIYIPKTWYVYDKYLENTFFRIYHPNTSKISDPEGLQVKIEDGNYTVSQLCNEVNRTLRETLDVTNLDISLNQVQTNENIVEFTTSDFSYSIVFYDKNFRLSNSLSGLSSNLTYTNNLGYYLGFRYTFNQDDKTKEPEEWRITFDLSLNDVSRDINNEPGRVRGQTFVNVLGPQYFTLIVDDFNYNQSSNGNVNIEIVENKLSLPKYINKIGRDESSNKCLDISNNTNIYVPSFPRKLTQNQLYAANRILIDRKATKNRYQAKSNSSVLSIIHLPNNDSTLRAINNSNLNLDMIHERKYFGPVTIERLKIKLLDDNNNIVNLHGHDWSCTFIIDQLYQY